MPAAFSITELTVVPHNALWYLKMLAPNKRRWYRIFEYLRLLSFVVFRLPISPYVLWHMQRIGQFGRFLSNEVHIVVRVLSMSFLVLFSFLNCAWTAWMAMNLLRNAKRLRAAAPKP